MPTEVIVDSSVIVALFTLEEYSDWASKRLAEYDDFHALDLNYYEVANALRHKQSPHFSAEDAVRALQKAMELMNLCVTHSFSEAITDALDLALELEITVYDAAFISLAKKLDVRFLTLDGKLAKRLEGTKYYRFIDCPNRKTA